GRQPFRRSSATPTSWVATCVVDRKHRDFLSLKREVNLVWEPIAEQPPDAWFDLRKRGRTTANALELLLDFLHELFGQVRSYLCVPQMGKGDISAGTCRKSESP